jgi:hypothetical protein
MQEIFVIQFNLIQLGRVKMSGYDSWLQSGAYDNEDEEIYIEERVPELMKEKEYDPADVSHMGEAIAQASKDDQEIIRDYIEQKDWAKLGQKLFYMTYEYMEGYAQATAQREVEQGL